jgi:peptidase S24-like protein
MIVYSETKATFTDDVLTNRIEDRVLSKFKQKLGHSTSENEIRSWKNSLMYMNNILLDPKIPADNERWIKVDDQPLARNMFVTRVHGKSMEPHIPDGSYCVFRTNVVGSRNNKTVLVQHSEIADLESGGRYSVKKYSSKKIYGEDGTWQHEEIHLIPHNDEYDPIIIKNADDEEFIVVGEFICTI